ncbi:MAG TPA: methyltransferase [Anaeromyxobacter sp.]|nr:methyltransferase [Anaeromyxobacter sp.]
MTDLRAAVLAALVATALTFLAGVRVAFRRPPRGHRYRASRVSGPILAVELVAVAAAPVPPGRGIAAIAMLAAAAGLFLWASWTNRARKLALAFAGVAPDHVQTAGPYALVRHPCYAAYVLGFLAGAVAAGTPWLAPAVAAGAITYWRAAAQEEEAFARGPLADAYRAYAARTGRFLPRLRYERDGSAPVAVAPARSRSPDGNAG